ncbi:MAG: hypothetical protein ACPHUK_00210 [Candidatus Poseidoniaceae archaeon]
MRMSMNLSMRAIALTIVVLFLGSVLTGLVTNPVENQPTILEEQSTVEGASQATSPGHVVFGQYISSDNCGHCSKQGGGSDAHHAVKQLHPDEYVYITYMSASYGDTDTSRAGNVAPYNWPWSTGGAPDAYFGDRTDKNQGGASSNYDTYDTLFSNGGGMHQDVNDYGMTAAISQSGSTYDIDITYKYTGSGSAASNMKLYAALVDKDCTGYSYSSGIPHGYNCWMAWLTSGDTYKSKSSGTGSSFLSVAPTATTQTESWSSVPASVVPGGLSKAIVIGVLMTGNQVSAGGSSPHVYHAIDSTMGPKMDLSIPSFTVTSPTADSYVRGDIITLDATIANTGDLDYTSGGTVKFYYVLNGQKNYIGQNTAINTLTTTGSSNTMTAQQTFDTSTLPSNSWKTVFGVELDTTGESVTSNNIRTTDLEHDRPPTSKSPQVLGTTDISRGNYFSVLAKGDANDNVDTIDTMTFDVEISPAGQDLWSDSIVTGGQNILYMGSANEGREYSLLPTMEMAAGKYDLRTRAVDARGQFSSWSTTTDAFDLMNAPPGITPNQVNPVPCDISTKVDMSGIIVDPETPLNSLTITSSDSSFVAWHPSTTEVEVLFAWSPIQGCPLGQQGIEISMDDGGDYSAQGQLPYGTLLFNVIENGQPRWQALPTQVVDEDSMGVFSLLPYLSDTDDVGNSVSASTLQLEIVGLSNNDVFKVSLEGTNVVFETVDDDVNGDVMVTLRASDGEQFADQDLLIKVNPINDAPRLDLTGLEEFTLKIETQRTINLMAILTDVDDPSNEAFITVTSDEQGAAKFNPIDGTMTLNFKTSGLHTVTINTIDRYDSNTYTITVDVFDSYPLYIAKVDDGSGHFYVSMEDTYIGQIPTANVVLTDMAPTFTDIEATWNICNDETGTCDGLYKENLDITRSMVGWSTELDIPSIFMPDQYARPSGSIYKDYYQLSINAVDSNGDDYKTVGVVKWNILEELPAPKDMDDEMLSNYIDKLSEEIEALELSAAEALNDAYKEEVAEILEDKRAQYSTACEDPRSSCPTEEVQSGAGEDGSEDSGNLMLILAIVGGVLFLAVSVGLLMRRNDEEKVFDNGPVWEDGALPIHDTVANSMYGGAAPLFQQQMPQPIAQPLPQPVAQPLPVPQVPAGPPLPVTGLPAGWTMEQWQYYGQQYLDTMQN